MPLTGDAKRDYQRRKMAERRGQAKTGETAQTHGASEGVPAGPLDPRHEHYWLRQSGDDFATCIEFEMQGRKIGGCGEVRKYEGKLLSTRVDGGPDLAVAIADSPYFKEIQSKMPVTKDRR